MVETELPAKQELEAARIVDILKAKSAVELKYLSRLFVSKSNRELLGRTELQVRGAVHSVRAVGTDTALATVRVDATRTDQRSRYLRS